MQDCVSARNGDVPKCYSPLSSPVDQQFALKWVQEHVVIFHSSAIFSRSTDIGTFCLQISKFGGDPKKVTIWGESAGAGSVIQQVVANGGKTNPPLFRAAITSSTYLPSQYKYNDRIPEVHLMNFEHGPTPAYSYSSSWFTLRRFHKSGKVHASLSPEILLTSCLGVHPPLIR